jgi:5'-3' exonuclease
MTTQILIDADFVLFRACAAAKREHVWENDAGQKVHTISASYDEAREAFDKAVQDYMAKLFADEAILVFSGDRNFRKDVWPLYKGNRAEAMKPPCYWQIIADHTAEGVYRVVSEPCLEGDDYLGILATHPRFKGRRVIVSEDKDMQTLPNVEIWRQGGLIETTEESADAFWRKQTLMGDSTDGYWGCPGIGPASALKVLAKAGDPWENIVQAYVDACRKKPEALAKAKVETPEELALVNARLARILRFDDWDTKARKPILWTPHTAA